MSCPPGGSWHWSDGGPVWLLLPPTHRHPLCCTVLQCWTRRPFTFEDAAGFAPVGLLPFQDLGCEEDEEDEEDEGKTQVTCVTVTI